MKNAISYIIVAALEDETIGLDSLAPLVHTGVGKINASIYLYEAILKFQPELIINFGTAGNLSNLKGLQKIEHFVQTDMDVRGLEIPRGVTPFEPSTLPMKNGITLGTSDSFITNPSIQLEGLNVNIDLVDMEAFALKKVCKHLGVEFKCYKFISDNANDDAGNDWKQSVSSGIIEFKVLLENQYGVSKLSK